PAAGRRAGPAEVFSAAVPRLPQHLKVFLAGMKRGRAEQRFAESRARDQYLCEILAAQDYCQPLDQTRQSFRAQLAPDGFAMRLCRLHPPDQVLERSQAVEGTIQRLPRNTLDRRMRNVTCQPRYRVYSGLQ